MVLSTKELLELVQRRRNVVEAVIQHGAIRATHWFGREGARIWHEGIDGEEEVVSVSKLLIRYPETQWTVED